MDQQLNGMYCGTSVVFLLAFRQLFIRNQTRMFFPFPVILWPVCPAVPDSAVCPLLVDLFPNPLHILLNGFRYGLVEQNRFRLIAHLYHLQIIRCVRQYYTSYCKLLQVFHGRKWKFLIAKESISNCLIPESETAFAFLLDFLHCLKDFNQISHAIPVIFCIIRISAGNSIFFLGVCIQCFPGNDAGMDPLLFILSNLVS